MQAAEDRRTRLKLMREAGNASDTEIQETSTAKPLPNPFAAAAAPLPAPQFNYYSDPLAAAAARPHQDFQTEITAPSRGDHGLPLQGNLPKPFTQQHVSMTWNRVTPQQSGGPSLAHNNAHTGRSPDSIGHPLQYQSGPGVMHQGPRPPPYPQQRVPARAYHQQQSGQEWPGEQQQGPPAGSPGRGRYGMQGDSPGGRGRGREMGGRGGRGRGRGNDDPNSPFVICEPSMLEDPWKSFKPRTVPGNIRACRRP